MHTHPDDVIDEGALRIARVRLGLSERELAKRCGYDSLNGWDSAVAFPARGFREQVERCLCLEPGALKLAAPPVVTLSA